MAECSVSSANLPFAHVPRPCSPMTSPNTAPAEIHPPVAPAPKPGRDVRLDFFRGLALIFIFLNHIPSNAASWITNRNFGFSDATEIFVFISGYSAAVAYGTLMLRRGFALAAVKLLHRAWQLYIAHIFLFVVFTAQIAYVATRFNNPMFSEEMNLVSFMNEPHVNLIQALLLKFRPANMDVLPLYIVLLLAFPPLLWLLHRRPYVALAASALLWLVANYQNWSLPSYPADKTWVFNPLCWQFLFVLGAWCGMRRDAMSKLAPHDKVLLPAAVIYLALAAFIVATWSFESLGDYVPAWLSRLLYPIDKSNMDVLRLVHFFALAYIVLRVTPTNSPVFSWVVARPLLWCGRHSLVIFCLGTFLAFTGYFYLVEVNGSVLAQLAVSMLGIGIMVLTARVLTWYKAAETATVSGPGAKDPVEKRGAEHL
jgi:hypothetical protein